VVRPSYQFGGHVVDRKIIEELPVFLSNPLLASVAPGITYDGSRGPLSNATVSNWLVSGGDTRNVEFLLDSAPATSCATRAITLLSCLQSTPWECSS
jgi:hypothetical protein